MEYNTDKGPLKLREYGRNVQNLAAKIKETDDKEKRNSYAETLVELMKQINPNLKDSNDYNQKVWDDLFIISDFDLDVESPFPTPNADILDRKPDRVPYKSNEIRFKHYGRNVEIMIEQAIAMEDPDEKEGAIVSIGRLMKSFFNTWNKDSIEDKIILQHLQSMSKGALTIDLAKVEEYRLFDSSKGSQRNFRNDNHRDNNNNHRRKGGHNKRKKRRN